MTNKNFKTHNENINYEFDENYSKNLKKYNKIATSICIIVPILLFILYMMVGVHLANKQIYLDNAINIGIIMFLSLFFFGGFLLLTVYLTTNTLKNIMKIPNTNFTYEIKNIKSLQAGLIGTDIVIKKINTDNQCEFTSIEKLLTNITIEKIIGLEIIDKKYPLYFNIDIKDEKAIIVVTNQEE